MTTCDMCGNDYDKAFTVIDARGQQNNFDSFECAIHLMAPRCTHCGCPIIGHGVEADALAFCCAHCASQAGVGGPVDNASGSAV